VVYNGSSTLISVPSAAITWFSTNSPAETITESNGGTTMMRADFRPPRDSLAGFWSSTNINETEILLYIAISTGVIFDVTVQLTLTSLIEAPATVTTTASGVGGSVYTSYFDGPAAGAVMVPVSSLSLN
jgi:hypothetical protein